MKKENDKIKNKWLKRIIIAVLVLFAIPVVFCIVIIAGKAFLNLGDFLSSDKIVFWVNDSNINIGDYLNLIFYSLELFVVCIFSYLVWQTSERLNKVEKQRDEQYIRENVTILYYDLVLGLQDLCKLKSTHLIEPNRLFFSDDWMKNISALAGGVLSSDEIKDLYYLYGELIIIKDGVQFYRSPTIRDYGSTVKHYIKEYECGWNENKTERKLDELGKMIFKNFEVDSRLCKESLDFECLNEKYSKIIDKMHERIFGCSCLTSTA